MYEVKVFKDNYDRGEFYSVMGKYFAERIYRKLLPYLINEKEKVWYLFFENQTLCGFCGVKKGMQGVSITDFYGVDNYKNKGILDFMAYHVFEVYKTQVIRVLTNDREEKKLWKSLGFHAMGHKGSYDILLWVRVGELV